MIVEGFFYQCSEILHPSLVLGNEGLSSGLDPKVWEIYLWLYSTVQSASIRGDHIQ